MTADIRLSMENIEDSLMRSGTGFRDRCDEIAMMPVTEEADIEAARDALDELISDMQAYSAHLEECQRGHSTGFSPGNRNEQGAKAPCQKGGEAPSDTAYAA